MRLILLRLVAIGSAATWLVFPGFGVADLLVTWNSAWAVVLEAGWGLFATVIVAAAMLRIAISPRHSSVPLGQLSIATGAVAVSAVAGAQPNAGWLLLLLAVEVATLAGLARSMPGHERLPPTFGSRSMPLLGLAAAGAVPWAAYAIDMYQKARRHRPIDISVGIDHYAIQGAFALGVVALAVFAAISPRGRRSLGVSAGLSSAYLGLVSLAWPGQPGGVGATWSVLALGWGVAVSAAASARAQSRVENSPQLLSGAVASRRAG